MRKEESDILYVVAAASVDPLERQYREVYAIHHPKSSGNIRRALLPCGNMLFVTAFEATIEKHRERRDTILIEGILPQVDIQPGTILDVGLLIPAPNVSVLPDGDCAAGPLGMIQSFTVGNLGRAIARSGEIRICSAGEHLTFSCYLRNISANANDSVWDHPYQNSVRISIKICQNEFVVDLDPLIVLKKNMLKMRFNRNEALIRVEVQREKRAKAHANTLWSARMQMERGEPIDNVLQFLMEKQRSGEMESCVVVKGREALERVLLEAASHNAVPNEDYEESKICEIYLAD